MATTREIIDTIDDSMRSSLTLTVGTMAKDTIHASRLLLDRDAAEGFRDLCRATRDLVSEHTPIPYATTAELDHEEFFVIDDEATLAELSEFRRLAADIGDIPTVSPAGLDMSIKLYAVATGETEPVLFVRRANPRIEHRAGRFLAIGQERLTRVQGPAFAFSADFDFLLAPRWAIVLNQKSFELLFRQIGLVQRHVGAWLKGITDHLPMAEASIDSLRQVAMRDSRTWRKLREIEKRGHLASVRLSDVRDYAAGVGLDPDTIVVDDKLVFDPAQRFGFLHLLNEDLYKGPLTDEVFAAQRKASTAD